eukprot:scaffold2224_cov261-Pinguiococcus_pyrenoidosus.AAC.50
MAARRALRKGTGRLAVPPQALREFSSAAFLNDASLALRRCSDVEATPRDPRASTVKCATWKRCCWRSVPVASWSGPTWCKRCAEVQHFLWRAGAHKCFLAAAELCGAVQQLRVRWLAESQSSLPGVRPRGRQRELRAPHAGSAVQARRLVVSHGDCHAELLDDAPIPNQRLGEEVLRRRNRPLDHSQHALQPGRPAWRQPEGTWPPAADACGSDSRLAAQSLSQRFLSGIYSSSSWGLGLSLTPSGTRRRWTSIGTWRCS